MACTSRWVLFFSFPFFLSLFLSFPLWVPGQVFSFGCLPDQLHAILSSHPYEWWPPFPGCPASLQGAEVTSKTIRVASVSSFKFFEVETFAALKRVCVYSLLITYFPIFLFLFSECTTSWGHFGVGGAISFPFSFFIKDWVTGLQGWTSYRPLAQGTNHDSIRQRVAEKFVTWTTAFLGCPGSLRKSPSYWLFAL